MALLTVRHTPDARTDLGSQFNTQHRLLETLAVVLAAVLLAAPAAAIGLGIAWFVWRVTSPSKLTALIFVAGGLLLLVVTNQDVLWLWPWGIFIPNRLFDILPPSSAITIPAAILHSVEIEICVGPAVLVLFDQLMRVRETTLAGGVYRQARRGQNGPGQYPGAMSPQAPLADRGHPQGGIRLGVDRDYQRRAFDLTAAELGLHTFLPGASGSGKTTTVARIADGAMAAGFGLVVIDCKGGGLGATARMLADRHGLEFTAVDPDEPDTVGYEPCRGTPAEIANKLVGSFSFGTEGEIYKQIAMHVLPLIVKGLMAAGRPVTLHEIAEVCDVAGVRSLVRTMTGPARDDLLRTVEGGQADRAGIDGLLSLKHRFGALLQGSFAPLFEADSVLDWDGALLAPSVTYVCLSATAASEDVELMGRVLIQDIKQVCSRRLRAVGRGDANACPVLVVIDEFAALKEATQIIDLLLQARQAGMPLMLATQFLPDDPNLKKAVLQSGLLIAHRLEAKDAEEVAAQFGTKPSWKVTQQIDWETGESQKGSVRDVEEYVVHPNTLRKLPVGQAAVRTVVTDRHAIVAVFPVDASQTQPVGSAHTTTGRQTG